MKRRIAVIGLGTFGMEIARQLATMGTDVIAIDKDPTVVQEISDLVEHAAVCDVNDRDSLRELGVDECDVAVLALRGHLDASVLAVLVLQELGVKEIVAQAVSEDHRRVLRRIGATRVIFPDKDMAERTAQMLITPDLLDYVTLAPGYGMSEIEVPDPFAGKTIIQVNVRQEFGVNIAAIRNKVDTPASPKSSAEEREAAEPLSSHPTARSHGLPFVPPPNYEFKHGDLLICLGRTEDLRRLANL